MLEFNPDGSLKLTDSQTREQELEKDSVIITREQISQKPAKVQIRIKFPEDIQNPDEILDFYHRIDCSRFASVAHSIGHANSRTFIIKVDEGSMLMYSLLNFMVEGFKMRFEQDLRNQRRVIVRGIWANFGNNSGV